MDEGDRRRTVIEARRTDVARWSNPRMLDPAWHRRALTAASMIGAGSRVLDIGCGDMALEKCLPPGCIYQPCDVVARDERTLVTDLNVQGLPVDAARSADVVVLLGVFEYLYEPAAVLAALAEAGRTVICSYSPVDLAPGRDRRAMGWVNDLSLDAFLELAAAQGLRARFRLGIENGQVLVKLEPGPVAGRGARGRVHVIGYHNTGNFGDRLGFHLLVNALPPAAEVSWGTLRPFTPVPRDVDLLVIGIGNSLFGEVLDDRLLEAADAAPLRIGIFGTQYRSLFPPSQLHALLDRLDRWYARYEEDALLYGRGRRNVEHLGDWMVNACPMAVAGDERTLRVGAEVLKDLPLDRTIQTIQRHQRVYSTRLHPLLCALGSARQVAYEEQHEYPRHPDAVSGKFRSMLMDVFGRDFPEKSFWDVDREAVCRYKERVADNVAALSRQLRAWLSRG